MVIVCAYRAGLMVDEFYAMLVLCNAMEMAVDINIPSCSSIVEVVVEFEGFHSPRQSNLELNLHVGTE
jgi:hypothetical protein